MSMILTCSGCKVPVYLYAHIDHTNFKCPHLAALKINKNMTKNQEINRQEKDLKYSENHTDAYRVLTLYLT